MSSNRRNEFQNKKKTNSLKSYPITIVKQCPKPKRWRRRIPTGPRRSLRPTCLRHMMHQPVSRSKNLTSSHCPHQPSKKLNKRSQPRLKVPNRTRLRRRAYSPLSPPITRPWRPPTLPPTLPTRPWLPPTLPPTLPAKLRPKFKLMRLRKSILPKLRLLILPNLSLLTRPSQLLTMPTRPSMQQAWLPHSLHLTPRFLRSKRILKWNTGLKRLLKRQ